MRLWLILGCALVAISANADNVKANIVHWYDKIHLGGSVSLAGFGANVSPTTFGVPNHTGHTSDLILNYADLNVTAQMLDWLSAYTDIAYAQTAPAFIRDQPGNGNVLFVSQAYLKMGGSQRYPYYLKAGIINLPFGGFNYSSNMVTLIQLLSLNGPPTLQVGIQQDEGVNGSIYVFHKYKLLHDTDSTNIRDYGADIAYQGMLQRIKYRLGLGYISNILSNFFIGDTTANNSNLQHGFYQHHVPAFDLQALLRADPFEIGLRYIVATQSAAVNDVSYTTDYGQTFKGAKLSGWSVNLGYAFNTFCLDSKLIVGYEGTAQGAAVGTASGAENFTTIPPVNVYNTNPRSDNYAAIGLPKSRYYALYKVHTSKWSVASLEIDGYKSYSKRNGGYGRNAIMAMAQIGIEYA